MWLFWCIYLVTGNITVNTANDTDVAFKNYAPFSTCKTVINDVFFDKVDNIYIAMPMYHLMEYSDNDSDTSGSLGQFKRNEVSANDVDLTINNSEALKCKAAFVANHYNENIVQTQK